VVGLSGKGDYSIGTPPAGGESHRKKIFCDVCLVVIRPCRTLGPVCDTLSPPFFITTTTTTTTTMGARFGSRPFLGMKYISF
jgi:hypothetical protein